MIKTLKNIAKYGILTATALAGIAGCSEPPCAKSTWHL